MTADVSVDARVAHKTKPVRCEIDPEVGVFALGKRLGKPSASDLITSQQTGVKLYQITQERRCGMSLKEPCRDRILGLDRASERIMAGISMVNEKCGRVRLGMAAWGKEALVKEDDRIRVPALENRDAIFAQTRMNEIVVIQEDNVVTSRVFQTEVAGGANPLIRDPMDFDRRMSGSQRADLRGIFCG
jgi:hypothetical protein